MIVARASLCPRQTLLFSATFPASVERLGRSAVMSPVTISVGSGGQTATLVQQNVVFVPPQQKKAKLLELLRSTESPPVLVFCNSHASVDRVVTILRSEQFHVAGLHGDKSQAYRFRVMHAFKEGKLDVLVATDLAARGIDVSDITHVIIYDMPDRIENYIHRAGRTGRAGKCGLVSALLTLDCKIAKELRALLDSTGYAVPPELNDPKQFGRDFD